MVDFWLDVMAYTSNPSTEETEAGEYQVGCWLVLQSKWMANLSFVVRLAF